MANDVRPEDFEALSDEALAALSQEGNSEATEYLLSKHRNIVRRKARTYFLIGADHEDIMRKA